MPVRGPPTQEQVRGSLTYETFALVHGYEGPKMNIKALLILLYCLVGQVLTISY